MSLPASYTRHSDSVCKAVCVSDKIFELKDYLFVLKNVLIKILFWRISSDSFLSCRQGKGIQHAIWSKSIGTPKKYVASAIAMSHPYLMI